jgi:hypothetical protein
MAVVGQSDSSRSGATRHRRPPRDVRGDQSAPGVGRGACLSREIEARSSPCGSMTGPPLTRKHCIVVYRRTDPADGFIVTAYFASSVPRWEEGRMVGRKLFEGLPGPVEWDCDADRGDRQSDRGTRGGATGSRFDYVSVAQRAFDRG